MKNRTWAEIDLAALATNFAIVRRRVGLGVRVLATIKADAYGHGAVPCAHTLAAAGADMFGVASSVEAAELYQAGITQPILVLSTVLPDDIELLLASRAAVNISDLSTARALSAAAMLTGRVLKVHLKVDTGMGRQGFWTTDAVDAARVVSRLPGLRLEGIFTHFPSADEDDDGFTEGQIARFNAILLQLEALNIQIPLRHGANSAAVFAYPEARFNLVRPGLVLFGARTTEQVPAAELRPVMSLKTRVIHLKDVAPGQTVSYGRTFTATRRTRTAVVPAGYADGISRRLSNRGHMLVRGRRAPIVGRVCMDQTMIDVTDIPGVELGDEVVVYGAQGAERITVEEVAERIDAIPYEIMCAVSKRVPRLYVRQEQLDVVPAAAAVAALRRAGRFHLTSPRQQPVA